MEHRQGNTALVAHAHRAGPVAVNGLRLRLHGYAATTRAVANKLATLEELAISVDARALNKHLAALLPLRVSLDEEARTWTLRAIHVALVASQLQVSCELHHADDDPHGPAALVSSLTFALQPRLGLPGHPADTLVLIVHAPRVYRAGAPAPLRFVQAVLQALQGAGALGHGQSIDPRVRPQYGWRLADGILTIRVAKAFLAEVCVDAGWKLPQVPNTLFPSISISSDSLGLAWSTFVAPALDEPAAISVAGASLAAEQDRKVFRTVDRHLAAGNSLEAASELRRLRGELGGLPSLVERLGFVLLERGSEAALAELDALLDSANGAAALHGSLLHLRALSEHARGLHEQAASNFERAANAFAREHEPAAAVACMASGAACLFGEHAQRAITVLREVLRTAPWSFAPHEALATLYARVGDFSARVEVLRQLAGMAGPHGVEAHVRLADALLAVEGRQAEAHHALERAIRGLAHMDTPGALAHLERITELLVRAQEAPRALQLCGDAALRFEALHDLAAAASLYERMARLWLDQHRTDQARLALHTAIGLDPQSVEAIDLLARLTIDAGELDVAIDMLESLVRELQSEAPEGVAAALRNIARVQLVRDDQEAAVGAYRRLLQHHPADEEAFCWLRDLFRAEGRSEDLADVLTARLAVLDTAASRQALLLELARLYATALHLPGTALGYVDQARAIGPLEDEHQRLRFWLLEHTGRHLELRDELAHLTKLVHDPGERAELHARVATIDLEVLGDTARAAQHYRAAVALRPRQRAFLLGLRQALRATGELIELPEVLERLADLTDDPASRRAILVEAGDVLFHTLGRPRRAFPFYRMALAIAPDVALQARVTQIVQDGPLAKGPDVAQAPTPAGPPTDVGPVLEPPAGLQEQPAGHGRDVPPALPAAPRQRPLAPDELVGHWTTLPSDPTIPGDLESGPMEHEPAPAVQRHRDAIMLGTPVGEPLAHLAEQSPGSAFSDPLPDPISEEFEVTFTAPTPGMVGLQLVGDESYDDLSDVPEILTAQPAPRPNDFVRASGFDAYDEVLTGYAIEPPAPPREDDADTPSGDAPWDGSDDLQSDPPRLFSLPDAAAAPDWKQAAQSWADIAAGLPSANSAVIDPEFDVDQITRGESSREAPPTPTTDDASRARIEGDHAGLVRALQGRLARLAAAETPGSEQRLGMAKLHQEVGLVSYYDLEDLVLAEEHLERACALDPDQVATSPETLAALEGVYEDKGDFAKLYTVLERRLDIADTSELKRVLRLLMAQLCVDRLGRQEDALALVRGVLEECPEHEPALQLAADIERSAGDFAAAADALRRLLVILPADSPNYADTLVALADTYGDAGDLDGAHAAYHEALATTEDPLHVLRSLQATCRAAEDWDGLLWTIIAGFALALGEDYEAFGVAQLLQLDSQALPHHLTAHAQHVCREAADILLSKRDDAVAAWELYGKSFELGGEDPYPLERRIELGHTLERWPQLVRDLESLTGLLINPALRFKAFVEAGDLARERIGDPLRARNLYEQAVRIYERRADDAPEDLATVKQRLARLRENVVVQFSIGKTSAKLRVPEPRASGPDALDEGHDEARRAAIDGLLAGEPSRQQRVSLLTEKGLLLSRDRDRIKGAFIALREALALQPDYVPARLAMAEGLIAHGELDQALNNLVVLVQRARHANLEVGALRELRTLLDAIVGLGEESCVTRAETLIRSLPPTMMR